MENNNYDLIKPVKSLQNIGAITPTKRQEEEKKQQQKQNRKRSLEQQPSKPTDEQITNNLNDETNDDPHSIDYCA